MKVSYNWLKEFVDFDYTPRELSDVLTMTGLEIGSEEEVGGVPGNLEGVVVGHVVSAEQHPNADRLRVCKVDVGEAEPLDIVCGAPNVAAGQKVPVALVGTTLHPFEGEPFKLKKGKIRGEVSMGMICAEDELGLGLGHDGILVLETDAANGTPLNQVVDLEKDWILEIELTPNRIDGASHFGAARDIAAVLNTATRLPEMSLSASDLKGKNPIPVTIEDESRCRRYTSIYISGVTVQESPDWMKKRLTSIGLRPINNIVDITNYVLMELGQPMHAFDADQLAGKQIIVKTLPKGETFVTLDEQERKLEAGTDLMICDGERPLCIAGVMGGLNSGVTESTKNVFLEVAYFEPGTVRKTSKRLGLQSDSSFRYERGADPHMPPTAAMRAASLIVELAGGTASEIVDQVVGEFPDMEVDLSVKRTCQLIGKSLEKTEIIRILNALDIKVEEAADGDLLHLRVPPYRVDVTRPQDVMEEILRIHGYNNVEVPAKLNASIDFQQYDDIYGLRQRYANALSANGFYEILNNSLVPQDQGDEEAVVMVNPLSEDLAIMRQSMLHGVLTSIQYNQNRRQEDLALYEFGKTYSKAGEDFREQEWLVLALTGNQHAKHWNREAPGTNLYTLGREVERLQEWFGFKGKLTECDDPEFDYGLELQVGKKTILRYGKVNGELTGKYDIRNEVFFARIDWQALMDAHRTSIVEYQAIPLYPSIRRDISMIIGEAVSFDAIRNVVLKANPKLIRAIDLHDVYMGKGIETGKKSYLISILLRDDKKTLSDKAAEQVSKRAYHLLQEELGAEIRM